MTPKQREIIAFARQNLGVITFKEALEFSTAFYNQEHHMSLIIKRMINAGMLERISKGVYKIGIGQIIAEGQQKLF